MRACRQRGHTILLLAVAMAIGLFVLLVATRSFTTTTELNTSAQAQLRADEALRRNLESLTNILRGADFDTIDGLDPQAPTSSITFSRVVGADRFGQRMGPPEEIRWRPSVGPVPGIENPGWLEHRTPAGARLIADRVPQHGLRAALDAGVLRIDAQTYAVVQNRLVMSRASTSIVPRN